MSLDAKDAAALQELEDGPHGWELKRLSRWTNVADLADRRLKAFVREQTGKPTRRGPIGIDIYLCRVGTMQRQFGRTPAEAIRAAIEGVPGR